MPVSSPKRCQAGVREDSHTATSHLINVRLASQKPMNKFPNIVDFKNATVKTKGKAWWWVTMPKDTHLGVASA